MHIKLHNILFMSKYIINHLSSSKYVFKVTERSVFIFSSYLQLYYSSFIGQLLRPYNFFLV